MSCCLSGGKSMQSAAKDLYHNLILKINQISSQLKLFQKLLLCPLLYMQLKRRELVYLLRVAYMR